MSSVRLAWFDIPAVNNTLNTKDGQLTLQCDNSTKEGGWNGNGAASENTSMAAATTSTSPVGRSGLTFSGVRAVTSPVTFTQYSFRSACAAPVNTSSRATT